MPVYTENLGISVVSSAGTAESSGPIYPLTILNNAAITGVTAIISVTLEVTVTSDATVGPGVIGLSWPIPDPASGGVRTATCPSWEPSSGPATFHLLHTNAGYAFLDFTVADGPCEVTFTPTDETELVTSPASVELLGFDTGGGDFSYEVGDITIDYTLPRGTADCPPVGTVWTPDLTQGVLEFLDAPGGTFTIPNHMVTWEGRGDTELGVRTLDGEDEVVGVGAVAMRRIERTRTANLALLMTFWSDASGGIWDNADLGWHENWNRLNRISDASITTTDGLQTLRWTPYSGATPHTFEAHVQRPIPGAVTAGKGMKVGLVIEIPDPDGLGL